MVEHLDKRYREILEQERLFIKRAVYHIHAYTPKPWWHVLIPFKVLLEYYSRKKDVRALEESHLYLKQIALAMAYNDVDSGNPGASDPEMLARLHDYRVHIQKLNSADLYQGLEHWLKLLKAHYYRLLQVQEKRYHTLVRTAYTTKQHYQAFLDELAEVEARIDRALLELPKDGQHPETYLNNRKQAFAQLRERELRETFGEN